MRKLFLLSCAVLCSQLLQAQTTNPAPYCAAGFDDAQGFYVDDHINQLSFGPLTNASNAQFAAPHYVFYNNLPIKDFVLDSTYNLSLNFKVSGGCGYGVWIDYNRNNTFEPSEKVAGTSGTEMLALGDASAVNKSIRIPATAQPGQTRMRIRIVEDDNHNMTNTSQLPCNASTSDLDVMDWGETEDYTINLKARQQPNAVHEARGAMGLEIAPNPGTGIYTLRTAGARIDALAVYSLQGQLVLEAQPAGATYSFDLSRQPKGLYLIKVWSGNQEQHQKLILQ